MQAHERMCRHAVHIAHMLRHACMRSTQPQAWTQSEVHHSRSSRWAISTKQMQASEIRHHYLHPSSLSMLQECN